MTRTTTASFAIAVAAAALTTGAASHATAISAKVRTIGCGEQALQTALDGGGDYRFAGSCSLNLTHTLNVPADSGVTLDADGHKVTINGEAPSYPPKYGFVPVFKVSGSLGLEGLTIAHGTALGTIAGGGEADGGGVKVESGGELDADNVVFSDDEAIGAHGLNAPSGQAGDDGATGAPGGDGDEGVDGGDAGDARGGAVYVAAGATAVLSHTTFTRDTATAGTGGGGSSGGSGGEGGPPPQNGAAGNGGKGADGSDGGNGGEAAGGAIFAAGDLVIVGGSFSADYAIGGAGGPGGTGGAGGAGGVVGNTPGASFGSGGDAANGGNGGDAGDASGGAIDSEATLHVKAASFKGDSAIGGNGGDGAPGGPGGSGQCPSAQPSDCNGNTGGDGGDGGDGGQGADGRGGAVNAPAGASLQGVTFSHNTVGGGVVGPDCPPTPFGACAGAAGNGGGFATTHGSPGSEGNDGDAGTSTFANATVKTTKLAPVKVTTTKLAAAKVHHAYSVRLHGTGGITPYHWKASGVPAGLKLHAASGKITGKPGKSGAATVKIVVSDPTAARPTTGKATLRLKVTKR